MNKKPTLIVKLGSTFPRVIRDYGDFADLIQDQLKAFKSPVAIIDPGSDESLPNPLGFAGIILTGSHSMITEHEPWSERIARWLPGLLQNGIPVLGVCYGHQLLAYSAGGTVGPNPNGTEISTCEIRLKPAAGQDLLFRDMPTTFPAHATHAQSVLKLPPNATSLAESNRDPHQAFFLPPSAWGIQFHPEFNAEITSHYIWAFSETLCSEGQDVDALLKNVSETPISQSILFNFGALCKLCTLT